MIDRVSEKEREREREREERVVVVMALFVADKLLLIFFVSSPY